MSDPAKRPEKQEKPVPNTARSNSEALKKLYGDMLLIRRFEERAGQLYGMGLIGGFCHLYIGQEAVVVGMQASVRPEDQLITAYRDHGHMLAAGMDPKGVMAELTGRSTGYSRGRRRNSTAATALSAPRCRWEPVWLSPTNIVAMMA
jgi:pyruvate dehydrogenase E1 component alpha subunit